MATALWAENKNKAPWAKIHYKNYETNYITRENYSYRVKGP